MPKSVIAPRREFRIVAARWAAVKKQPDSKSQKMKPTQHLGASIVGRRKPGRRCFSLFFTPLWAPLLLENRNEIVTS